MTNDRSAIAIPGVPCEETIMNAVIVYDNVDLASKAQVMLGRAAHRADADLAWTVKPWRIELLLLPPASVRALEDAAEAHLIVLAVRRPAEPSPRLLDWLEQWARCRLVQDAALALFDGGNDDVRSGTAAPELAQFAQRYGLSFLFGDVRPAEEASALLVPSLAARAPARTAALAGVVERSRPFRYRLWGINE